MRVLLFGALAALALVTADAGSAYSVAAPAPGPAVERADAAAREAAETQATALLNAVALPLGSTRTATEPGDDGGALGRASLGLSALLRVAVTQTGWATVPEPAGSVLSYLHEHPPAEATVNDEFYPPAPEPPLARLGLLFPMRRSGPVSEVFAQVTLLALANGTTDVRIDALALWVPAPWHVGPGARLLRVKADFPRRSGVPPTARTITSRRTIEAVRALVNGLPAARPSIRVLKCPAAFGSLSLAFYPARGPHGSPPALVQLLVGGCGGAAVIINGAEGPFLTEGNAPADVARLTGVRAAGI